MSEAMQIQLIEKEMQKETASITVSEHFTDNDHKCMQFLFNADYEIILQSFEFKHAPYLEKKLVEKSKIQQNQQIQRKYELLSQRNHKKLSPNYSQADHLLNRLQFEWQQKKTDFFHRYYFSKYINNEIKPYVESLEKILLNEEKLIKSDLHILYAIDRAIKAREGCLNQIRRVLSGLSGADIEDYLVVCGERVYYYRSKKERLQYKIYGYKINKVLDKKVSRKVFQQTKFQQFGHLINHYRKLTLHVIELITKWKSYIYSLTFDRQKQKEAVDYFFQNQNYLLKLINDNSFVSKSFLADYFSLAAKNDTFLLMPVLKLEKDEKELGQKLRKQESSADQRLTKLRCLKRVLAPDTENELLQMQEKIRILTNEYQVNIKKKKTFDLRTIEKINNLDYEKSFKNLSKSQVKLKFSRINDNITKSTVSSIRSESLKLSKLSTQKVMKTVQSGKNSPLKKQHTSLFKKKTLLKLTEPLSKETLFPRQQSLIDKSNPETAQNFVQIPQKLANKKYFQTGQLQILKQQIKQKIKSEMNLHIYSSGRQLLQKPQFYQFIDLEVKKMMNQSEQISTINHLVAKLARNPETMKEDLNLPVFVETYSIQQTEVASHLKSLFEHETLLEYEFMQLSRQELINGKDQNDDKYDLLENLPCLYFLKVKQRTKDNIGMKQNIVSNIIFTIKYIKHETLPNKKHSKTQRTVQILYMTIKSHLTSVIEKTISKTVDFLFKYQTATSVVFHFYYDEEVEAEKLKIAEIKWALQKSNCLILQKYILRTNKKAQSTEQTGFERKYKKKITQVKFHFSKQNYSNIFQINCLQKKINPNLSNSFSFSLELYGLFSAKKLEEKHRLTQAEQTQFLSEVNYDYLLTEILKNHIDSESFRTIGNREPWQNRLRAIIQSILVLKQRQKGQQTVPFLEVQSFISIQELNKAQKSLQKPCWDNLIDSSESNTIKMLSLQLNISLPYLCRVFINSQGKSYFRFEVKQQIQVLNMQYKTNFSLTHELEEVYEQKIFLFECLEKKNLRIGLFDATNVSEFLMKKNSKIKASGTRESPLGIADLINGQSFMETQDHGQSMKLLYKESQYVGNMFVPMFQTSSTPDSSEPSTQKIYPVQCKDLQSISKNESNHFFLGDNVFFKYDVHLENGIRYNLKKEKNVIFFESQMNENKKSPKRMGIVVFLIPEFVVMYTRII